MSVFRKVACAALILAVTAACSGSGPKADPAVKRDFVHYLSQLAQVTDMESEALAAHVKATEDPSINDAAYGRFLANTFIPKLEAFYGELQRIHPTTEQIIGLHKILLRRTTLMIAGFSDLEKSARTGDNALIESARAKNAESDILFKRWKEQLDELDRRYSKSN
ncbi:MAG: hypothetical protein WC956_07375 [bacterium]